MVTNDWFDDQRSASDGMPARALTSFFANSSGRFSKLAIRRAKLSTNPSSSASGRARFTQPYFSAVIASKSSAPTMISNARDRPARAVSHSVAPPAGHNRATDFDLSEDRFFAACKTHITGKRQLASVSARTASYFGDTNDPRLGQARDEGGPLAKRCCARHIWHNFSSHDVIVRNEVVGISAVKHNDFDVLDLLRSDPSALAARRTSQDHRD